MNPGTGGVIQRRARARGRMTAPCLLPPARRAPAARCAGSFQAQVPGPSSTTIHRRRGRRAPPHASLRRAAPARPPRARGAARARIRASSRARRRARSIVRSRPISTRNRARCDSSASFNRNARATSVSRGTSARPRFAERAGEREQHRTPGKRDDLAFITHDMTASVDDECFRAEQRFDFLEQEEPLLATRDQARGGRVQDEECAFDLRRSAGMRAARCALGASECRARRLRPEAPHRDARNHELVGSPRRGRKRCGVELGEGMLGLVEAPDQKEAPDFEVSRVRGVHPVAVRFERGARRVERLRGQARSREASAISASATTHLARATASSARRHAPHFAGAPAPGRDRRAAPSRCRAARARARSSRSATRFNAPRGSPAASARAAAVISESIEIPSHLSLPPFAGANLSHDERPPGRHRKARRRTR